MFIEKEDQFRLYLYFSTFFLFILTEFIADAFPFQPEFAEPIVNISVAVGRDATFTCHVRYLGGYRVSIVCLVFNLYFITIENVIPNGK